MKKFIIRFVESHNVNVHLATHYDSQTEGRQSRDKKVDCMGPRGPRKSGYERGVPEKVSIAHNIISCALIRLSYIKPEAFAKYLQQTP